MRITITGGHSSRKEISFKEMREQEGEEEICLVRTDPALVPDMNR